MVQFIQWGQKITKLALTAKFDCMYKNQMSKGTRDRVQSPPGAAVLMATLYPRRYCLYLEHNTSMNTYLEHNTQYKYKCAYCTKFLGFCGFFKKYYMCSLDVTSLYTNVPVGETIQIIIDALYTNGIQLYYGLNSKQCRKLFE